MVGTSDFFDKKPWIFIFPSGNPTNFAKFLKTNSNLFISIIFKENSMVESPWVCLSNNIISILAMYHGNRSILITLLGCVPTP